MAVESTENFECLVLDFGSGYSKVGFAGADKPASVFPTIIGSPRDSNMALALNGGDGHLVGKSALQKFNDLFIDHPVDRGMLFNEADTETLLDHAFEQVGAAPSLTSALITEPPLVSVSMREKLTQIMFETMECPSFYFLNQSSASLFSVGRTTGMVVNVGDGTTTALPIADGICCSHSLHRSEFAGMDLTKQLQEAFIGKPTLKPKKTTFYSFEEIKQKACFVSLNPEKETSKKESFKTPDGTEIVLADERYLLPESFFNPTRVSDSEHGATFKKVADFTKVKPLPEAVCESIATSEEEYSVRQAFFENIMLTGGSTKLAGFKERFLKDIVTHAPTEFAAKVIPTEGDAMFSAWVGGSIMALLSNTKEKFITKEEYDEQGLFRVTQKISLFES